MANEGQIPHQAVVVLNAVVNKQNPDGTWHPRAVHHDRFILRIEGETEEEVIADLKKRLKVIEETWTREDQKSDELSSIEIPPNSS
jgi:hypothetical protein